MVKTFRHCRIPELLDSGGLFSENRNGKFIFLPFRPDADTLSIGGSVRGEQSDADRCVRLFRFQIHRKDDRFPDSVGNRVEDQTVESSFHRIQSERVFPAVRFLPVDLHFHGRSGDPDLGGGIHIVESPLRAAVENMIGTGIGFFVVFFDTVGDFADFQIRKILECDAEGDALERFGKFDLKLVQRGFLLQNNRFSPPEVFPGRSLEIEIGGCSFQSGKFGFQNDRFPGIRIVEKIVEVKRFSGMSLLKTGRVQKKHAVLFRGGDKAGFFKVADGAFPTLSGEESQIPFAGGVSDRKILPVACMDRSQQKKSCQKKQL